MDVIPRLPMSKENNAEAPVLAIWRLNRASPAGHLKMGTGERYAVIVDLLTRFFVGFVQWVFLRFVIKNSCWNARGFGSPLYD